MTRRSLLKIAAAAAASGALASKVAHSAPGRVRMTHHRVPWAGRRQLRVVQLTDLHVGWGTPQHLLEQSVQLCCRARPDLVVLTGDYLNRSLTYLPQLERWLRRLPRPCVATLGNHDHWSGADAVSGALHAQGIPVLRNENVRLALGSVRLPIVGIDDGFTNHDDVDRAFAGLECPETALVLTHFPTTARRIATCGGRLVLAGHTHGGQIEVPIVTQAVARLAGSHYLAGWYRLGCTRLYVSAGIGSSTIRWRLGARAMPEVAVFDLCF